MNKFTDFATEEHQLTGKKLSIESILNKEIIVKAAKIGKSKYDKNKSGNYLTLQFDLEEKEYVLFTSSDVLISQIHRYEQHIPFITTIKKMNRYFSFS